MIEAAKAPQSRSSKDVVSSELGARVASALVLGGVALAVTWLGGWPFAVFWLAAGLVVGFEWVTITAVEPQRPLQIVTAAGLVGLAVAQSLATSWIAVLTVCAVTLVAILVAAGGRRERLWATAGLFYAAVLVLGPPAVRAEPTLGLAGILWMFAVVWSTDIAAYFAGRRFGGPKLWPGVSPKKTWSGFVGGLAAGTLAGVAVAPVCALAGLASPVSMGVLTLASAIASVAAQLGDLGESALKRHVMVKDSGRLIPGHGGVMDRLDGFWAVALLLGLVLAGARLVQH